MALALAATLLITSTASAQAPRVSADSHAATCVGDKSVKRVKLHNHGNRAVRIEVDVDRPARSRQRGFTIEPGETERIRFRAAPDVWVQADVVHRVGDQRIGVTWVALTGLC